MLQKLKELVNSSCDQSAEQLLDKAGIKYEYVRESDWIDEGKFQHGELEVKIEGKNYIFYQSRSGSYYTEYYYDVDDVEEYVPDTRYSVAYVFPSKEVAQAFTSWMSGSGEQMMWQHAEDSGDDLNRDVTYNYETGSMEIKGKFEEKQ